MLDEKKVLVPSDLKTLILLYGGSGESKRSNTNNTNNFQVSVSTNTSALSSRLAAANRSISTGKKSLRGISSHSLSHEKNKLNTPSK